MKVIQWGGQNQLAAWMKGEAGQWQSELPSNVTWIKATQSGLGSVSLACCPGPLYTPAQFQAWLSWSESRSLATLSPDEYNSQYIHTKTSCQTLEGRSTGVAYSEALLHVIEAQINQLKSQHWIHTLREVRRGGIMDRRDNYKQTEREGDCVYLELCLFAFMPRVKFDSLTLTVL